MPINLDIIDFVVVEVAVMFIPPQFNKYVRYCQSSSGSAMDTNTLSFDRCSTTRLTDNDSLLDSAEEEEWW